ncbi:MerR family transcriptional regulator [Saccharothrix deserti]|uniref:MerR family transcriptional regulator n=1 Tax=Saccharothrix deserti TaxID=2593674 RepID=UPI00131A8335|nr:MerR family transcriptional regulator [Saccharothrix deserti]
MNDTSVLSIAETVEVTGLTAHTLRYYERIGLLDPVGRGPDGRRRFRSADLAWLGFLTRLRTTGMSIRDMQRFAELRRRGDVTTPERLELLERHRDAVRRRIAELSDCLASLDAKIDHYRLLSTPGAH